MNNRKLAVSLFVLAIILSLISIGIGRYHIAITDILKTLFQVTQVSKNVSATVLNVRIPRTIGAIIVGLSLATAGAIYQGLFGNPMASPNILGAASGAGFGAALALLWEKSDLAVQLSAFILGIIAVLSTKRISQLINRTAESKIILVLVGMVVSALFSAFISITKYFADVDNQLPSITFWLMGGLGNIKKNEAMVILPIVILLCLYAIHKAWVLNVLSCGDEESAMLGINVKLERSKLMFVATLLSSIAVSLGGMVGWVGILIPHIARMLVGSNYRELLPVTALLGCNYMMIMDILARNIAQVEIPLGILTAIIGAPFFAALLLRTDILNTEI
ncbi:iron ABC transporter permease [Eubacteriaceae bacterium ES2]|nr:iron ABC transporter permease [Eubacteriaceae bacterium ES2]